MANRTRFEGLVSTLFSWHERRVRQSKASGRVEVQIHGGNEPRVCCDGNWVLDTDGGYWAETMAAEGMR